MASYLILSRGRRKTDQAKLFRSNIFRIYIKTLCQQLKPKNVLLKNGEQIIKINLMTLFTVGVNPIQVNSWNMPENPWPKITYGNAQLEISCDAFFSNNQNIDLLKNTFLKRT
jgi:alanine-alpha-ketoisovalerate/valine-pyruvate aminotransferase